MNISIQYWYRCYTEKGGITISRIYSNYIDIDFEKVSEHAKASKLTISAFQKACVMMVINKKININKEENNAKLICQMIESLKQKRTGMSFIVSELFEKEDWDSMSRSDKLTLAKQLSLFVKNHPNEYKKEGITPAKTTIYKKIGDKI